MNDRQGPVDSRTLLSMKSTGMSEETELLAVHHSLLTTWAVQRFGKALLVSVASAFLFVVLGAAVSSGWYAFAPLAGVLGFAVFLAWGIAPAPTLFEDE